MKHFRDIGLATSLAIGGVLGGLVAPVSSGAVDATRPEITIKVESLGVIKASATSTVTLLNPTSQTCPPGGPNYCYPLETFEVNPSKLYGPANRQFKVMHAPNQTAKLNISDYPTVNNTSPSDTMVLTGVQFVPIVTAAGWPSNEKVILTITVKNKFDAQPNPSANGTTTFYPFGMTVGGYFSSSPSPIGNISQMWGKGIFVTNAGSPATGQPKNISNSNNPDADTTVNSLGCTDGSTSKSVLCKTVAAPGSQAQLTFTAGQNSIYYPGSPSSNPTSQRFACSNNAAAASKSVVDPLGISRNYTDPSCQPEITEVHNFTLFGPDSVILSASSHSGGAVCSTSTYESALPSCDCTVEGGSACDSIAGFLGDQDQKTNNLQVGIPASVPCSTEICNGTLRNLVKVTPAPNTPTTFTFIGAGPRIDDFSITSGANGRGAATPFEGLITGRGGTDLVISADTANWPQKGANKAWQVDNIVCTSLNGSTIIDTDTDNGSGPTKGPLTIHAIGNGDTLTCLWHIHNKVIK
jgi:hypothetical protein